MIRLDHLHVLAAFHRYRHTSPWWRKRAIVNSSCIALEIHAQLEEEIFYPALAKVAGDDPELLKSWPEHDEIRDNIARLRAMGPENAAFDALFMRLMNDTLHHVADEETVLLPRAERLLANDLKALGAQMNRRRVELLARRPAEIAVNSAATFPMISLLLAFGVARGLRRVFRRSRSSNGKGRKMYR